MHGLWRTIALTAAEGSRKLHDRAAAVHRSAPVLCGSYRRCAASFSSWALVPITGTAGAGLALPWVQPFCMEEDDVSMSSAAAWGRRVLLRVRMLGACYMGLFHGSLCGSRTLGSLGHCAPPVFRLYIRFLTRA